MRKLEIEYQIENMSVRYEETTASWYNAEFTCKEGLKANLKIWENDIEPEQIVKSRRHMEERGEQFEIAMRYLGNHSIAFKKNDYVSYYFDEKKFTPRDDAEIECVIKYLRGEISSLSLGHAKIPAIECRGVMHQSAIPLATAMPLIPFELHGRAKTLIVAGQLASYPDLQLKLAYLLLEDFLGKPALKNDKMKYARDFVSHPFCDTKELVKFISGEIPSAKLPPVGSKDRVQFERGKSDHIAFVSKWATLALQKAKGLFEAKVKSLGGCI